MSYYDYLAALQLDRQDPPFFALIQCAMRRADTDNLIRLQALFPEVWSELQARYNAPGGLLPEELAKGDKPDPIFLFGDDDDDPLDLAGEPATDAEEPVEIQLTILWEVGVGTLVAFAGQVTAIEGPRRFRVHDGTDDVVVELPPDVEDRVAVGDLVAVVGRKLPADRGAYIEAQQVDPGDLGRGLRV